MKQLIASALLVVCSLAHAEIKREDYPTYSAYLAALSADTAEQMEKELSSEPAPAEKAEEVVDDYDKADGDEFGESGIQSEIDRDRGVVVLAHSYGRRATCKIMLDDDLIAQRELRDREKWTYQHDQALTNGRITTPCTAGSFDAARVDKDGTRLVIKNLTSKTRVCRVKIKGRPTIDTTIAPDMSRSFMRNGRAYRWSCHWGTQYAGDLSEEPMRVGEEG